MKYFRLKYFDVLTNNFIYYLYTQMFSLCHWFKNCITNYFTDSIKAELITKIIGDGDLQSQ